MEIRSKKLNLHLTPVLLIVMTILALGIGILAQVINPSFLKDGVTSFNPANSQDNHITDNLGDDAIKYIEN